MTTLHDEETFLILSEMQVKQCFINIENMNITVTINFQLN